MGSQLERADDSANTADNFAGFYTDY